MILPWGKIIFEAENCVVENGKRFLEDLEGARARAWL